MNVEFLYNLALAIGLFVGLTLVRSRLSAVNRAAAAAVRAIDRARGGAGAGHGSGDGGKTVQPVAVANRYWPRRSVADGLEETRSEIKAHLEKQSAKPNPTKNVGARKGAHSA